MGFIGEGDGGGEEEVTFENKYLEELDIPIMSPGFTEPTKNVFPYWSGLPISKQRLLFFFWFEKFEFFFPLWGSTFETQKQPTDMPIITQESTRSHKITQPGQVNHFPVMLKQTKKRQRLPFMDMVTCIPMGLVWPCSSSCIKGNKK